jgi:glycerol-3-phosphate dehydrogenase (NAD(P)+)
MRSGETVAVLGAGNMGSAMAHLIAGNGSPVVIWDHFASVVDEINADQKNSRYLPGIHLNRGVTAAIDPARCVEQAKAVVLAVPSPFVASILERIAPQLAPEVPVLNAAKGLDPVTKRPIHETVSRLLPKHPQCLLAGPAIANEFAAGQPAAVLLAAESDNAASALRDLLENSHFRVATSTDVVGAALGGILKNIYALLFGYLDSAIQAGRNLEGTLLASSIAEMAGIAEAFGARRETLYGRAGLGDLAATGFSTHSHNRRCGRLFGSGKTAREIEAELGVMPEGVRTVKAVADWIASHHLRAPLALLAQRLVNDNRPTAAEVLEALE